MSGGAIGASCNLLPVPSTSSPSSLDRRTRVSPSGVGPSPTLRTLHSTSCLGLGVWAGHAKRTQRKWTTWQTPGPRRRCRAGRPSRHVGAARRRRGTLQSESDKWLRLQRERGAAGSGRWPSNLAQPDCPDSGETASRAPMRCCIHTADFMK